MSEPVPAMPAGPVDVFDAGWLDLREAADHAARARAAVEAELPPSPVRRIIDLGAGTGSNLRYLMPRLGGDQIWRLVDHDPRLLAALPARLATWAAAGGWQLDLEAAGPEEGGDAGAGPAARAATGWVGPTIRLRGLGWRARVSTHCLDLGGPAAVAALDALDALDAPDAPDAPDALHAPDAPDASDRSYGSDVPDAHGEGSAPLLVTASALLDLVSAAWLDGLLAWSRRRQAAILFALTFDGRVRWSPPVAGDDAVTAALVADQQRDKGLGPALGPRAAAHLQAALAGVGMVGRARRADWQLGPAGPDAALQQRLAADWAAVAGRERGADRLDGAELAAWHTGRSQALAAGRSILTVGHHDIVAWPAASDRGRDQGAGDPGAGDPGAGDPGAGDPGAGARARG